MNEAHTPPKPVAIVLGRNPDLSLQEIESALGRARYQVIDLTVTAGVALVKALPTPDARWFSTLGGAVKFGSVVAGFDASKTALAETVKTHFGLSRDIGLSIVGGNTPLLPLAKALKRAGLCRRFVLPTSGTVLSAAQSKQLRGAQDRELLLIVQAATWQLIDIRAVQNIDDQTRRDRLAPEVHAERGMLPTKLARIMVNLGLGLVSSPSADSAGSRQASSGQRAPCVLDPFVGTGRILMEARLLGAEVRGADIDPAAVTATIRNLEWLTATYHLEPRPWDEQILQSDVRTVAELFRQVADVIVTEPYLGPPQRGRLKTEQIEQLFLDLEPIFDTFLRVSPLLLKRPSGIVMVFPAVGTQSLQDRFVDKFSGFGYHVQSSIRVERPDQLIARDIVVLSSDSNVEVKKQSVE